MVNTVTLDFDTPSIKYLCEKDKRLSKVISMIGPISYSPYISDPYGFLVHEIIEQMLSVKAGEKIFNRLVDLCDGSITPETINSLSDEQIKSIGTARSKVTYIRFLTDAILNENLNVYDLQNDSDEEVYQKLTALKGIGSWTAKMFLIFVLDRKDILPYEDVAFLQAYMWLYKTNDCSKQSIEKRCKKWKPYSSIASRYLYRALDSGLTKNEFHLNK